MWARRRTAQHLALLGVAQQPKEPLWLPPVVTLLANTCVSCQLFCLQVRRDLETRPEIVNLQDEQYIRKTADRMQDVGQKFEYLLNTGNLVSRSGLDLSQSTGFTVVAEKLNYFR